MPQGVLRKGRPIYPQQIQSMKTIHQIVQEIQCFDPAVRAFDAHDLPQSVRAYLHHNYRMDARLTDEEQQLVETSFEHFADNLREAFQDDPRPDATRFYLFDDLSLYVRTNAGPELWADAQVFVVERILPSMRLTRLEADLMREIGMDDQVSEVRDDFFSSFAHVLHRDCGIPHCDAREHWNAFSRQLGDSACEAVVLGGSESGRAEGLRFAESFTINA
jgi:hypothetical protein